jgi:hypothetical protein
VSSFRSRISVLLLGLCGSACSLTFVTPPPYRHDQPEPRPRAECTTSLAAPIADGLIAGFETVRTIYAVASSDEDYQNAPIGRDTDAALGLLLTGVFTTSAIYGGVVTSRCSRLKQGPPPGERPVGVTRD